MDQSRDNDNTFSWKQFTDHLAKELNCNKEETVKGITSRINATDAELENHKKKMNQELSQIRKDIAALAANAAVAASPNTMPTPYKSALLNVKRISDQDLKSYWWARKCDQFFPIEGETDKELWGNLQTFMQRDMRIPASEINEQDIVDVRRMRMRRGKNAKGEVIVVFADVEPRDRATSYARNLASFVGSDRRPTAGVRMEIPAFLKGVHKALLQYGHGMKLKHGVHFKRNIRFEDADHTLVIDVMIPSPDNPKNEWITVSYDRVLDDRKKKMYRNEVHHGERLSSVDMGVASGVSLEGEGGGPVSGGGQDSWSGQVAGPSQRRSAGNGPNTSAEDNSANNSMGGARVNAGRHFDGVPPGQSNSNVWGQHR